MHKGAVLKATSFSSSGLLKRLLLYALVRHGLCRTAVPNESDVSQQVPIGWRRYFFRQVQQSRLPSRVCRIENRWPSVSRHLFRDVHNVRLGVKPMG